MNVNAVEGSFNVPTSSRCYDYLWRLVGLGYVRPQMVGQRPYSMKRFKDSIKEAKEMVAKNSDSPKKDDDYKTYGKFITKNRNANRLIEAIENECIVETGGYWINTMHELNLRTTYSKGSELTIIQNNGAGLIDAKTVPLLSYNRGEGEVDGFYSSAELDVRGQLSDHFYYLVDPIFLAQKQREGDAFAGAHVRYGYGVFTVSNFALELGRDELVFGPSVNGGLLLSTNPRALDSVRVYNPKPARLPWFFKYLGEWQLTLFGANLGPESVKKYAWMTGYSLNLMPIKWLELGFNHAVIMGGEGTPNLTAIDVFGEFLGFRPAGTSSGSVNKTNHLMGVTMLARFPWRGLEFYGELNNEDKRDSITRFFMDGSAWLFGFHLPSLTNTSSIRVEYTRTSPIHYRHSLYSDGFTLNERIMGSDLGSAAHGVYLQYIQSFPKKFGYKVDLNWDYRSSDIYESEIDPDGTQGDISVIRKGPADQRLRTKVDSWLKFKKDYEVHLIAGYEHAWSCGYVARNDCNNWLIGLELKFNFRDKFKMGRYN